MQTNRMFLWIAATLLSGAFCAYTAVAQVAPPTAHLTAVSLAPENAPRIRSGFEELAGQEPRFRENLQLSAAVAKISKVKYQKTTKKKKARKPRY